MSDSKLTMFGKTYNTVGSTDSNFVIKTKGDLKILWGNKFIDVIKNGKINSSNSENLLFNVETEEDIKNNGIYLVNNPKGIWVNIDGNKLNILNESDITYVSFLTDLKDVTPLQKDLALKNIGFYYDTILLVPAGDIISGIVYIKNLNKLYTIINGQLLEYSANIINNSSEDSEESFNFGDITIYPDGKIDSKRKLLLTINNDSYIHIADNNILFHKNISMSDNTIILSVDATLKLGYRLYNTDKGSILEVDKIICRDFYKNKSKKLVLYKSNIYGNNDNIITNITKLKSDINQASDLIKLKLDLKYSNTFKDKQKICFYASYEDSIEHILLVLVTYTDDTKAHVKVILLDEFAKDIFTIRIFYNGTYLDCTIFLNNSYAEDDIISDIPINVTDYKIILSPPNTGFVTDSYKKAELFYEGTIMQCLNDSIIIQVKLDIADNIITKCLGQRVVLSDEVLFNIDKTNIDLLDRSKLIEHKITNPETGLEEVTYSNDDTIHTRIGNLDLTISDTLAKFKIKEGDKEKPKETIKVGIYSDNMINYNSLNYDPKFLKINDYPLYVNIQLPNEINDKEDITNVKYDQIVPNIKWVKLLLSMAMPPGTIIMFYPLKNKVIPKGWAICNGENGTPDLRGKFIKASDIENIGENITDLNDENKYSLKKENIPNHTHPHIHKYTIGSITGYTGSTDLGDITSTDTFDYLLSTGTSRVLKSVSLTENKPKEGEAVGTTYSLSTTDTSVIDSATPDYRGVTLSIGSHSHSLNILDDTLKSTDSVVNSEADENSLPETVTAIKFEPHAYSLVFLMKL